MSMTYYTVDDLRPGRPGWDVRQFSALAEAIDHYRTLPMDGTRVLGMMDDAHAYELIRCVRLFPGDAQGEDVLAADHWRDGLTKKNEKPLSSKSCSTSSLWNAPVTKNVVWPPRVSWVS